MCEMVETSNQTGTHSEASQSFLRAARSGNVGKITEHLNSNVNLNAVNSNGLNALHLAAKEGHLSVVRLLLDHQTAVIDAKTKKGNTALHIASLAGRLEIVQLLIERGADVNAKAQNGFTPLYMSAQENHVDIVELLLNVGANQALATDDGFTPLAVALQLCHDPVVTLLLERDAGGRGRLPALHVAAKKDDVHATTLLLANSDIDVNHASTRGFTPLHIAARYGNVKVARLLISNGADVNYCAKDSITPLHLATKWGKPDMTKLLIDKGAQVDARTRDGLTPMHTAARSGHHGVVQILLEAGANLTAKTRNGLSPLHMAAQSDHADTVKLLLKKGAPPDDVTMDYLTPLHIAAHCGNVKVSEILLQNNCDFNLRAFNGFTPLHVACKKMKVKVVELLLQHGAVVEATTQAGLTPLHASAFVGCAEAARLLLHRGANVNQTTVHNETPLHFAVRGRHLDTIKVLLKSKASVDAPAKDHAKPLHIALRMKDAEVAKLLIDAGADVNAETRGRHQPLHLAAKCGDVDTIKLILSHHAVADAKTKRGYTALHIASKYNRLDAMRLLLDEAHVNVNEAARNSLTPLHVAVHYEHPEAVNLLLEHGADVNAVYKNGFTPLQLAAKSKSPEIAQSLLKANADCQLASRNGYTPLHFAALEGHLDIIKTLVDQYSAEISLPASDGLTPLHLATQSNHVDVVRYLLERGADVLLKTSSGYTPLHEAAYRNHQQMLQCLLEANKSAMQSRTMMGSTPLHLAAQQGHLQVVNHLLAAGADANARNMQGWTPAQLARRQHYLNIFEILSKLTTGVTDWEVPSLQGAGLDGVSDGDPGLVDGSMILDSPAQMLDQIFIETEDESDQLVSTPVVMRQRPIEKRKISVGEYSLFKTPSYEMLCDQMEYTRAHKGEPRVQISARESMIEDQTRMSSEQMAASNISVRKSELEMTTATPASSNEWEFEVENIQTVFRPVKAGFLVSFLVDARGGFVEAQRRPDLRFMIPPNAVNSPTRIVCRLLRPDCVTRLPHLNDGDALACRIIEMSPSSLTFDSPILIEVPHFASIQGRDREVIILRCDNSDAWKAHSLEATDQTLQDTLGIAFGQLEPSSVMKERRIQRILTTDIPQFFALVSRFRQEISLIGPDGGILSSTVAPKIQAVFPKGALQKRIKVGIQAQVISPELIDRLVGNRWAFSPVVTIEPRRRKFHKPITITIPLPRQHQEIVGKTSKKSEPLPQGLRLFCSITAGTVPATWEDITTSTAMVRSKDCVSFTTTVSARLWLVDAPRIENASELVSRVYQESIIPPYIGQFAIYARLPEDRKAFEAKEEVSGANGGIEVSHRRQVFNPNDAELRCICLIDDAPEKTLEKQEKFQLVAVGPPTEVMDSKPYWIETVGDISSYPAHANQLSLEVQAFQENRLTYPVRVRQSTTGQSPIGVLTILRHQARKEASSQQQQQPVTKLTIMMPGDEEGSINQGRWLAISVDDEKPPGLKMSNICTRVGADWIKLAQALNMSPEDIEMITNEPISQSAGPEADRARCQHMLSLWQQRKAAEGISTGVPMSSKVEEALISIGRSDALELEQEEASQTSVGRPYVSRVYHIDDEIPMAVSPTTRQNQQPPTTLSTSSEVEVTRSTPVEELRAEQTTIVDTAHKSSSVSSSPVSETMPPVIPDGPPRRVPSENMPTFVPKLHPSLPRKTATLPRDDMSLVQTEVKPVIDEFIVASENLKRKNLFPEGPVTHADSVARQMAAEELAEVLGLDNDEELISVVKQSEEYQGAPPVVEEHIEPIAQENVVEFSPRLEHRQPTPATPTESTPPASSTVPCVKSLDTLHVDAESAYDSRLPSIENLHEEVNFENIYEKALREVHPSDEDLLAHSPSGLAGHDVVQGRPEEGIAREETEMVLPDGTVLRQVVHTTETGQTVTAHDWEEAAGAAVDDTDRFIVETPEETIQVQEIEETLPDGNVVKKRIITQLITERITEHEISDEVSEGQVPDERDTLKEQSKPVEGGAVY